MSGEKFVPFTPPVVQMDGYAKAPTAPAAAPVVEPAAEAPATVEAPAAAPVAPAKAKKAAPVPKVAPGIAIPGNFSYTLEETLLEVTELSVHYAQPVLRDVSFAIKNIVRPGLSQGQVNALLAPSGMGKTQLFRCISGLKTPDKGNVVLGADRQATKAGKVGVVAQDYPLFAHLTVFDNILMAAKLKLDAEAAKERTISMLERFELDDRREFYPHQLSGGQKQRVAIIQQMVACGHLLLMDEPFSGLDVLMKERVQDMITQLAAEDELNSIILTTHDIQSAIAVSDTIVLLGRERDIHGNPIPGARVIKEYNLMDMGLTWRENNHLLPQFHELDREINARFHEL